MVSLLPYKFEPESDPENIIEEDQLIQDASEWALKSEFCKRLFLPLHWTLLHLPAVLWHDMKWGGLNGHDINFHQINLLH